MKKRIMMSLMIIGLVSALVGGATFAWFTDTAANEGNTFTAGELDINLTDGDDAAFSGAIYEVGTDGVGIAPGWNGDTKTIKLTNDGTLPLMWRGYVTVDADGTNDIALKNAMRFTVSVDGGTPITVDMTGLADGINGPFAGGTLAKDAYRTLEVTPFLPDSAGNLCQGGSFTIDIEINATQTANTGYAGF
ncbi:TasA family protein [Phosphitispora fastidiosa]|uniref:TasA family protein n=1 Tax=Phosphitispora fastidiosa TaxID=2837202 RepID=UPI001E5B9194|nr:TasA family protein [Phosphitispora fastidiosa]MBU7005674.1 putative ribosomally synthesized peptide with SipW-like signal peptide [Phosphitispora fastidiosa]